MFRERTFTAGWLILVALVLVGAVRPPSPRPSEDDAPAHTRFFVQKTHQDRRYDGVVLGDSRGLRGIAPEVIEEKLPGSDIFNFSFNAGGMNPEMFHAAEQLLDPASPDPCILLAPTSLSLLPHNLANAQYHEFRATPRDQVWLIRHAFPLLDWLRPLKLSSFGYLLAGATPEERLYQVFHESGWIETDQVPHDDYEDVRHYLDGAAKTAVMPELVAGIVNQVEAWTAAGIAVYGVFPPAYAPRIAKEDSVFGFDRQAFAASFEAAGGVMLDPQVADPASYDGSHLTGDAARRYSAALGELLARRQAR